MSDTESVKTPTNQGDQTGALALLTADEMYMADKLAIEGGISGVDLMENAGHAIVREMVSRLEPGPVAVLCGPGNNGGDGFVVARILSEAGWPTRLALLGDKSSLTGDAAHAANAWTKETEPLSADILQGAHHIVDALFGAGLSRPLSPEVATIVEAINASPATCVSVDVPTGIQGTTGQKTGAAVEAVFSVTFFRKKPGHVLMPGRAFCGEVITADIGIPATVLDQIQPQQWENAPDLWLQHYPWAQVDAHKYARGHTVVVSGGVAQGGAARLAARGALRAGAGLVTIAAPPGAVMVHASQLNAIMVSGFEDLDEVLSDGRKNVFVLGPGNGIGENTRTHILKALKAKRNCVLDADGLTSFQEAPEALFEALQPSCVLTPHDGEFARLFPDIVAANETSSIGRLNMAREAAARAGAIILLKGPDSVIAAPDGRAAINTNAPPTLATAGSGDVLAGIIGGLLAQHMPAFEATCAGVWLHGEAARAFGAGLIAEDIPEALPFVLRKLKP
jgi:ADP-dependent NAD(P)H-hydrate dehydratase / NAD(P)H-hydrate epimerase